MKLFELDPLETFISLQKVVNLEIVRRRNSDMQSIMELCVHQGGLIEDQVQMVGRQKLERSAGNERRKPFETDIKCPEKVSVAISIGQYVVSDVFELMEKTALEKGLNESAPVNLVGSCHLVEGSMSNVC